MGRLPKSGVIGADDVGESVGEALVVVAEPPCEPKSLF